MPNRKLVKIGETPKLPTIEEFFLEMSARQHDEIRKLKEEIAGHPASSAPLSAPVDPRKPVPDPWLLHPTRIKRAPAKLKPGKKKSPRSSKGRATAKKTATKKFMAKKKSSPKSGRKR
jgi:hypothetical protein